MKKSMRGKKLRRVRGNLANCVHCGTQFLAIGRAKYCGRPCRNKAYYQARKQSKTMKRTRDTYVSVWTNRGERVARLLGKSETRTGLRYKVQPMGWEKPIWIEEKHLLGKIRGRKGHKKVIYTDPRRIPPEIEDGDSGRAQTET